jgi:hypothetical protein
MRSHEQELAFRLTAIVSAAFNNSLNALENAGAIETTRLRQDYRGIGSKYYDIVTGEIERVVKSGVPWIADLCNEACSTDPDRNS